MYKRICLILLLLIVTNLLACDEENVTNITSAVETTTDSSNNATSPTTTEKTVADVPEEFTRLWNQGLNIEYKSEHGVEVVSFMELFKLSDMVHDIKGNNEYRVMPDSYFENTFPRIMSSGLTKWYKENIAEDDIRIKENVIKAGEYYRFFVDNTESWLISGDWHEVIRSVGDEKWYYTVSYNEEYDVTAAFKEKYDEWIIKGLYNTSCVQVTVVDEGVSDEELANRIFSKYVELYTSAGPDNIYGVSDMKMTSLICLKGTDMDGKEINDNHKVFRIGYAFKPNVSENYERFYDYGTGEWEDWIVTGDDFYVEKVDGIWFLTDVGKG